MIVVEHAAYDEETFRYFLANERRRTERSGRRFLLLLVDLKAPPGVGVRIDPAVAPRVFTGLRLCLRETDFIGWYREGRVAGAVLTELDDVHRPDVVRRLGQRVGGVLCEDLPSDMARRLKVRVYRPEPEGVDSGGGFHAVFHPDVR